MTKPRISRTEFIKAYCKKSGLTDEWAELGLTESINSYKAVFIALPCECGDRDCEGWTMLTSAMVLNHLQFNAPRKLRKAYIEATCVGEKS